MGDFYGQLANISAVLAGFSLIFLALLLAHKEEGRLRSSALAVTIAATAFLLSAALGWALINSFVMQHSAQQSLTELEAARTSWMPDAHIALSRAFVFGLFSLLAMLGLSGWLRSRYLGIFSTVCSFIAALTVLNVLKHMMN